MPDLQGETKLETLERLAPHLLTLGSSSTLARLSEELIIRDAEVAAIEAVAHVAALECGEDPANRPKFEAAFSLQASHNREQAALHILRAEYAEAVVSAIRQVPVVNTQS